MSNFITNDESAQFYESGYSCDNAILLKLENELVFITDSRYTIEAKENLKNKVELITSNNLIDSAIEIIKKAKIKTLTFDPNLMNVSDYERLNSIDIQLESKPNFHQHLRIQKSPLEIELIRKSQKLNKVAYKNFAKLLNTHFSSGGEKIDERTLHAIMRGCLEHNGRYDLSFNPIVAINANAAKPHALPGKNKLKNNDLLLVDAGIKFKRYCSDCTRTAILKNGKINFKKTQKFKDKLLQKIYDTTLKAQEFTIKNIKAGMSGKEIDALARGVIEKAGFKEFFTHSTGHGIGLDIHELPRISTRSEDIIKEGMVFSIEPGIYIPDKFGVRIEDLVVIEGGKARVL